MVIRHLADYDITVIEAVDGLDGVRTARRERPDLILLDITMPVMDGWRALEELRRDRATQSTPVIMLTVESGRDLLMEADKLGVAGYIVKPFRKETLEREVSKALSAAAGEEADRDPNGPVDRRAVLVVDDSERVLARAEDALAGSMTVLTALSGEQALDRYREARPAVVVIDLEMPGMDGFQTLAEIRKLGPSACVALAVRGDRTAGERAEEEGFESVVEKPFQSIDLSKHVRAALIATMTPEDLLQNLLCEEHGCAVLAVPRAVSTRLARLLPEVMRRLRGLAEDGQDKLVVDLTEAVEVTSEQATSLAHLVSEAEALGIRTAICASHEKVVRSLQEVQETRDTPCAPNREAAAQSLR
jgi:CheY-like chemotaxis protein